MHSSIVPGSHLVFSYRHVRLVVFLLPLRDFANSRKAVSTTWRLVCPVIIVIRERSVAAAGDNMVCSLVSEVPPGPFIARSRYRRCRSAVVIAAMSRPFSFQCNKHRRPLVYMPVNSSGRGGTPTYQNGPYSSVRGRRMGRVASGQSFEFRAIWCAEKRKFSLVFMGSASGNAR